MWGWMQGKLGALDARVADEASKRARSAQAAGVLRSRNAIRTGDPGTMAQRIGDAGGLNAADVAAIQAQLGTAQGRRVVSNQYAAEMPRGPMGMGQMGLMEALNTGIAQNKVVRRGVLPVGVAAGGVAGGMLLTEGAQQLLQLMGFLRGEQQEQARTDTSPLAQADAIRQ